MSGQDILLQLTAEEAARGENDIKSQQHAIEETEEDSLSVSSVGSERFMYCPLIGVGFNEEEIRMNESFSEHTDQTYEMINILINTTNVDLHS